MNKYENLGVIGEGSYGIVMKCRHKNSGEIVAIKKFLETDDDHLIRKIAMREINLLRKLRHENLVNLIEVFRRKKHLYLVLEFVAHTILDALEQHPGGLGEDISREYIWQVFRGLEFCHSNQIIHRDVKPENVLVSTMGVIKLCDFGFARMLSVDESCTDYVATRWYRAPELLVGDTHYGKEVDVWAAGCLLAELLTGNPLFPGESDIDQLFCIIRYMGKLAAKHQHIIAANPMFLGIKFPPEATISFMGKFSMLSKLTLDFLQECLKMDPEDRLSTSLLLHHQYFTCDSFPDHFGPELQKKLQVEFSGSLAYIKPQRIKPKSCVMQQYVPAGMKEDTNESPTNEKFSACPDSQVLPPCNALASKTAQPLKHPNKITPLTPSHLPKDKNFESKENSVSCSMPPIGYTAQDSPTKSAHDLKKTFSPHHFIYKSKDVEAINQLPHWIMTDIYRKPVPVMRKNEAPLELNRLDSSSSPVCDVGAVQGERSFLYARSVTQSSKKFGYATEVSLKNQKENNSALPNIFQPSAALSPLKSKSCSQKRLSEKTVMPSIVSMEATREDHAEPSK